MKRWFTSEWWNRPLDPLEAYLHFLLFAFLMALAMMGGAVLAVALLF